MSSPRVVVITDPSFDDDVLTARLDAALAAAPAGAASVQLRDKARDGGAILALATRLRDVTARHGAKLIVNGRLDIALAVGADGAHLGGGAVSIAEARTLLGPGAWISAAAHAVDDVAEAARRGADAVLVSPIFATPGKGEPRGVRAIAEARRVAPAGLSVLALGGVTAENAGACVAAGATGVALVRGVLAASDPAGAMRTLIAFMAA